MALAVLAVAVAAVAMFAALLRRPWPQERDGLVQQQLPLADGIARSFCRRYGDLVELDDLRQEARLELVRAASRCRGERPEPFLQRCIAGALRHHLRDRALLVRLPAKRRDAAPWRHVSLDAPAPGEEESRLEQLVDPVEPVLCQEGADAQPLGPHLAGLLGQLSPLQRSVLRLTVLEGVSMRKAAERLGVAPATVQQARRQGLEGLREGLVE